MYELFGISPKLEKLAEEVESELIDIYKSIDKKYKKW